MSLRDFHNKMTAYRGRIRKGDRKSIFNVSCCPILEWKSCSLMAIQLQEELRSGTLWLTSGKMGLGEKKKQTADKQPFCGRPHKQRWRAAELESRLSFCWLKCVTQTLRQFRFIRRGWSSSLRVPWLTPATVSRKPRVTWQERSFAKKKRNIEGKTVQALAFRWRYVDLEDGKRKKRAECAQILCVFM